MKDQEKGEKRTPNGVSFQPSGVGPVFRQYNLLDKHHLPEQLLATRFESCNIDS